MTDRPAETPIDVLGFWWGAGPEAWFRSDPDFDTRVRTVLGPAAHQAAAGKFGDWGEAPHSALARIILLDQVPRNIFRKTPAAFAWDPMALEAARAALKSGFPDAFPKSVRSFFYLPFEHSEDLECQLVSVDLMRGLGQEEFHYALMHYEAIARFGRFPHRNAILGRSSSPAEVAWLEAGGFRA